MNKKFTGLCRSVLAALLVVCMAVSVFPVAAFAAESDDAMDDALAQLLALLEEHGFATEGDPAVSGPEFYLPAEGNTYVALGDGSVVKNKNVTQTYAEMLAAQLNVTLINEAEKEYTAEEQLAALDTDAALVAKIQEAEIITLGFGNVTFLNSALSAMLETKDPDLDWTKYLTDEETAEIKAAIKEICDKMVATGNPITNVLNVNAGLETFAYECIAYIKAVPQLVEAIRVLNNQAAVLVIGMYNPMEGVTINVNNTQLNLDKYIEAMVNVAALHVAGYCYETGNAAYVDARDVATMNEKQELDQWALVGLANNNCSDFYPSTAGHTTVKNEICKYLTSTNELGRIAGSNRCDTARLVADQLKAEAGIEKFNAVIYTNGLNSADALAGSYLSAKKTAPLLLYLGNKTDPQANLDYIKSNLSSNGTVYILGGPNAVPETVDADLAAAGIQVQRVQGAHRYATNLEILKAGDFTGGEILVCTGIAFADSLSASATGKPILLVAPTAKELTADQKAFLADKTDLKFVVVGGTSAVTAELEASLIAAYGEANVDRLAGGNRYETSTMVAERYFGNPEEIVIAYAITFPDGLCGGALAYAKKAPLILTYPGWTQMAESYVSSHRVHKGTVLGGTGLVDDASVAKIFGE